MIKPLPNKLEEYEDLLATGEWVQALGSEQAHVEIATRRTSHGIERMEVQVPSMTTFVWLIDTLGTRLMRTFPANYEQQRLAKERWDRVVVKADFDTGEDDD